MTPVCSHKHTPLHYHIEALLHSYTHAIAFDSHPPSTSLASSTTQITHLINNSNYYTTINTTMAWRCCNCAYHNRGPSELSAPCQNFFRQPRCIHAACGQCMRFIAGPPAAKAEYKHLRECRREERRERRNREGSCIDNEACGVM